MNLQFINIQYDYSNDTPFVIFENKPGKNFYLKIDHHTANDILNHLYKSDKEKYHSSFYNIFVDFFDISDISIENLSIDKNLNGKYSGQLTIKKGDNIFCYYLDGNDIILLSVLFGKSIKIPQNLFFDLDIGLIENPIGQELIGIQ
ncbi:MAG TPA: hypothetical protein PK771_06710 [Spirochaetota bacterium]|nr:hypothetical protein [Spirochaetota bacterium]